jgi:hypothetical protein
MDIKSNLPTPATRIDSPEITAAPANSPRLPDLPLPADISGALMSALVTGGRIPELLRWFEPEGFDRALENLAANQFPLELRDAHYYLKAQDGEPGSLAHLRQIIDSSAHGVWYLDRCSRDLSALLDRIEHRTLCHLIYEWPLALQRASRGEPLNQGEE